MTAASSSSGAPSVELRTGAGGWASGGGTGASTTVIRTESEDEASCGSVAVSVKVMTVSASTRGAVKETDGESALIRATSRSESWVHR